MGGNNYKANVRLNAREYYELKKKLDVLFYEKLYCAGLVEEIPQAVKCYKNKETFGDIDFLCAGWNSGEVAGKLYDILWNEGLIHKAEPNPIYNGPFTSYPIGLSHGRCFQLDMIGGFDKSETVFAYWYFAYNDLGNFVGRFAHKIGLKYGHRGLFYPLHWTDSCGKDVFLGDIQLSKNPIEVLEFLQFDPDRWLDDGFKTMEEIYEMVVTHPWFYSDMFNLKDVSHNARVRDRKRKNYSNLLNYIENNKDRLTKVNPFLDKWKYLEIINAKFPILEVEIKKRISDFLLKEELKKRWNGSIVMEQSKRAGFVVEGKAIAEFNSDYKLTDLELLKLEQDQINSYIFDKVNAWIKTF